MGEAWVVVLSAVVSATISALAAFLFRDWLGERVKASISLSAEANRHAFQSEIERLRYELQAVAVERQTRFAALHAKSMESLAGIHHRMAVFIDTVHALVSSGDETESASAARALEARNAYHNLRDYFAAHQVYISKSFANRCEEIVKLASGAAQDFAHWRQSANGDNETQARKWAEAMGVVRQKVPPLLDSLAADFRKRLGVED